jgi:hypothetical protein
MDEPSAATLATVAAGAGAAAVIQAVPVVRDVSPPSGEMP